MRRALKVVLGAAGVAVFYALLFFHGPQVNIQFPRVTAPKKTVNILYWTPMFGQPDFNLGLGREIFENCTHTNCMATFDRKRVPIEQFDAILFHAIDYNERRYGKPETRLPHQVYVFSNQESPIHTPSFIGKLKSFYNWTMTYRLDSDIIRPYGFFEKTTRPYTPPAPEEIQARPKKIAWMVSNCGSPSHREFLATEIAKFVPLDIYGTCGNHTCSKDTSRECYRMVETNYKFYLSFENSLCEGYVTEKLFNILQLDVVPIVYGAANYSRIAPPHSVIDVSKYSSVEELVKYLEHLDRTPEEYLKYFEWKKDYVVDTGNKLTLCSLCQKLNQPIRTKIYKDIAEWWDGRGGRKCEMYNNLPLIVREASRFQV